MEAGRTMRKENGIEKAVLSFHDAHRQKLCHFG